MTELLTAEEYDAQMSSMYSLLQGATLVQPNLVPVETGIPGITAEYCRDGERLKFHFFCDGPFSPEFVAALSTMRESVGHKGPRQIVCDYTPEVKSWYFEFCPTAMIGSGSLATLFVRRLADLVKTNAEGGAKRT